MSNIQAESRRPPVVTVVGHVDHGKTSLLDALLKTKRAAKEVGGITQTISAHALVFEGRNLTFVDTPGHEAFVKMRRRGGQLADIVLLVVDAAEGVKPQTIEAINQIKEGRAYPIVVITKTDLPGSDPEKVLRQVSEQGLLPEGLGGQIPVVKVSIRDPESLKKLLELILLLSDLHPILASPEDPLEAVVVESSLDSRRGPIVLVVVLSGILKVGQEIFCGRAQGKVRSLTNTEGQRLLVCSAGDACLLAGLNQPPPVGELLAVNVAGGSRGSAPAPAEVYPGSQTQGRLKIVLKADSLGSLEAVAQSLRGEPNLAVVFSGVGDISDGDISLAREGGATVVGFNVRAFPSALSLAQDRGVETRFYSVIYLLLEEIKQAAAGLATWQKKLTVPGASLLKVFDLASGDRVLGVKVNHGTLKVGQNVLIRRGDEEIFKSSIKQLRLVRERVEKVGEGKECGVLLKDKFQDNYFQAGDSLSVI